VSATYLEMATEVDRILGNREGTPFTNAKLWVNRAYQTLLASAQQRETLAVATIVSIASTPTIAMPSDFFSVLSLRDTTNDARLIQISLQRYDQLDTDTEGIPSYYALGNGVIYLWRTPDAINSYTLRYRKRLAELTADGTEHGLDREWDQVIIYLATYMGFVDSNELERANAMRGHAFALAAGINDRLTEDMLDRDEPIGVLGLGLYGSGGSYRGN
jgi:hypothetical protein